MAHAEKHGGEDQHDHSNHELSLPFLMARVGLIRLARWKV
jgi:hypothetical protein